MAVCMTECTGVGGNGCMYDSMYRCWGKRYMYDSMYRCWGKWLDACMTVRTGIGEMAVCMYGNMYKC